MKTVHELAIFLQCDLRSLPPVVINQGMKRQPMAVHLIREILSAYEDLPSADQEQLQNDGCTTVTADNVLPETGIQSSVGYEDALPVNEFLSKCLCDDNNGITM